MAVLIRDTNETIDSNEFKPFDDSTHSAIRNVAIQTSISTGSAYNGINTKEIDQYRQGIEINSHTHRFKGHGAKIWAGNIKGFINIQTLGDHLSFTDYEKTKIFEETLNYNPVAYINSIEDVYFSDIITDVPTDNREANVQPFTIKARDGKAITNCDPTFIKGIKGNLEDGNQKFDELKGNNSTISQFFIYKEQNKVTPYSEYNIVKNIVTHSYETNEINQELKTIIPYNDINQYVLIDELNTTDSNLITLLRSGSDINLDEDLREIYGLKSMSAGGSVYGPYVSKFGTDSMAFVGFLKGN